MSSIVALCFKKKKYQFRHWYRFKSIGLAPVSEKTQKIPIPNCLYFQIHICVYRPHRHHQRGFSPVQVMQSGKVSHFAGEGKYADISTKELLKYSSCSVCTECVCVCVLYLFVFILGCNQADRGF